MRFSAFPVLGFIFLSLFACQQTEPQSEISYPLETAKLISGSTAGVIGSSAAIRVIFSDAIIDSTLINRTLTKKVFSFDPSIDGKTYWQDRHTLIFKPNHRLPLRQSWQAELDLALLLNQQSKSLLPFKFHFQTAGREVESFSADFSPARADDPKFLRFKGKIAFTEALDLDRLTSAAMIKLNGKAVAGEWQADASSRDFTFISIPLARTKQKKTITLALDESALKLSAAFSQTFPLPRFQTLSITDVQVQADKEQPQLRITFSDELMARQTLQGLIQLRPSLPVRLKIAGKKVLVNAAFAHGQTYSLMVKPGVRSKLAVKLKKEYIKKIHFENLLPEIRFSGNGVFLPSGNEQKLLFQTVNVRRVDLKIIKVFDSNLGQFLHMEALQGKKDRRRNFRYNIHHVGVDVVSKELTIGTEQNRWLQHELDLKPLLKKEKAGLFLIRISFKRKDMIYKKDENSLRYNRRYDYYNDPTSYGYLYNHGSVYKPLIISDLGITYKQAGNDHHVFIADLVTAQPLSGVRVKLFSVQNQILASANSDAQGTIVFRDIDDKIFYITAEKDGQRSVVTPGSMRWNLSTFDTKGLKTTDNGLRAFIYTERGVYRPGDVIHLSAIFRNEQNTFPAHHPVTLTIKNPQQQTVFQRTLKNGTDGLYSFSYKGEASDITGTYQAEFSAGGQKFYRRLKIETVLPERLKVQLEASKNHLGPADKQFQLNLNSAYLMGNPASNLKSEVSIELNGVERAFKSYKDFRFSNPSREFRSTRYNLYSGPLDTNGNKRIVWNLPRPLAAPSAISGRITAKVLEKSGRPAQSIVDISIDPYSFYVGVKNPQTRYGSIRAGSAIKVPVVLVDSSGIAQSGHTLKYRIYKNEQHWWYEYNSRDRFRLRFKRDRSTELLSEGTLVSGRRPVSFSFTAQDWGQYFVEVQDGETKGHSSGFFFRAHAWGNASGQGREAGVLSLQTDKKLYHPGDEAILKFPVPKKASLLFTLEKGDKLLKSQWLQANGKTNEQILRIPITEEMLPNVYASVSVIQPQTLVQNDRPVRMYGVIPLNVASAATRLPIKIVLPAELSAGKHFKVKVRTANKISAQLTIAVVDEGLLSLTRFSTPDPRKAFYSKQRLNIRTSDLYEQVIGMNHGAIFSSFSIGGGINNEEAYRQGQLAPRKNRFRPVSLFSGIIQTDANGRAEAEFDMPEYIGAVRVMVVAVNGKRYGHAQKSIPVKKPLMLLPSLPRSASPGDLFTLPVTVFKTNPEAEDIQLRLTVNGPLRINGSAQKTLHFEKEGQQDAFFILQAKEESGPSAVSLKAEGKRFHTTFKALLAVRPAAPRLTRYDQKVVEPGQQISFMIPADGLPGSNTARLQIRRRPDIKLTRRILRLIQYPYGCIEQTVSTAFPQLYIQDFIPESHAAEHDIDNDINETIYRLSRFQLASGGCSYWPGHGTVSVWGTLYAAHFLIEARQAGYHVAPALLDKIIPFTKQQLRIASDWELMEKVYAVYVLSLADQPALGSMNLLRENHLSEMNDTERWLLAAAYALAGNKNTAEQISRDAGLSTEKYKNDSRTFGSAYRDKALILEQLIRFKYWKQASALADELAEALSSDSWYSTQTSGVMLVALGKYLRATEGEGDQPKQMSGSVVLPDGQSFPFKTDKISYSIEINRGFGQRVSLKLDTKTNVRRVFAELEWTGLPLRYTGKDEAHNIQLERHFLDEDGIKIDPASLRQGQSFWMHFRIKRTAEMKHTLKNLALTQVLPAGWEIDNYMLISGERQDWMSRWHTGRETYRDFRDDRAMWFFDLDGNGLDFVVKLNAVTTGRFFLPPALAEAMYNHSYRAQKAGRRVQVTAP